MGRLRKHLYAGRQKWDGVAAERIQHHTAIAAVSAAAMKYLPHFYSERARFALNPIFDRWVCKQIKPGDHLITSFSYANEAMKRVTEAGGLAILDAGNSHPANFWTIVNQEHKRWGCEVLPVPKFYHERSMVSAKRCNMVIGLSSFVTRSFIERGLPENRTFILPRPLDLSVFHPSDKPREKNRPFTIVCAGSLSLRKGIPYLFEAVRLIQKQVPNVRLWLNQLVTPTLAPLMDRYSDVPIEWFPRMSRTQLADHYRRADLFILPSLEDGLARAATEAMGCGLPVILSENTGAADLVTPGKNGEIVPICNADAVAEAALKWWERIEAGEQIDANQIHNELRFERFLEKWDVLIKQIDQLA